MNVEKTGKTVAEAVEKALNELGIPSDEAEIEVLEEPTRGLLGIGGKQARVRVGPRGENPPAPVEIAEAPPAEKPKAAKPSAKKEKPAEAPAAQLVEKLKPAKQPAKRDRAESRETPDAETLRQMADTGIAFLQKVAPAMGMEATFEYTPTEDGISITATGGNLGRMIGHRGETLDALQYITAQVMGCHSGARLRLDAEGYRARREAALLKLADEAAGRVVRSRKRVVMEAMNPAERRIIHTALQDHLQVTTISEGEEPRRRVVVLLKGAE